MITSLSASIVGGGGSRVQQQQQHNRAHKSQSRPPPGECFDPPQLINDHLAFESCLQFWRNTPSDFFFLFFFYLSFPFHFIKPHSPLLACPLSLSRVVRVKPEEKKKALFCVLLYIRYSAHKGAVAGGLDLHGPPCGAPQTRMQRYLLHTRLMLASKVWGHSFLVVWFFCFFFFFLGGGMREGWVVCFLCSLLCTPLLYMTITLRGVHKGDFVVLGNWHLEDYLFTERDVDGVSELREPNWLWAQWSHG